MREESRPRNDMKISRAWLQNFFEAPLPDAIALSDALTFHAFEIEGVEKAGADDIIDVKVTPNRGHDALSHRAIAKELAGILQLSLKTAVDPFAKTPDFSKKTDAVTVTIQDANLCRRYIAGYVKGVKVGASPEWLKTSLEAIGQRSINNIVDATNLVMFNIGQPLHAFDAAKLGSLAIGVRCAKEGEELIALDDKTYKLKDSMLVITAADVAVGIAGVKGGKPTGIDESTNDIVIESANFDGPTTRRTAAALKLATDASQRFQQEISPELCAYGMQQVVDMISAVAGGEVQGFVDVYPSPQQPSKVSFTAAHTSKLLGIDVSVDEIKTTLSRHGFASTESDGTFSVDIPFERLDLRIPEDLIEEVGRMIGYDRVTAIELPAMNAAPSVNQNFAATERVRKDMTALGYSEVITSVFADKGEVAVLNKVDSVKPFLRSTLTDGLNDALKKNVQNKDLLGLKEVKLFEIGTVWAAGGEEIRVGIVTEKEKAKEDPLSAFVKVDSAYEELPISATERYQTFSRYPSTTRDIALWVPASTAAAEVQGVIESAAGPLRARTDLFDEFKKGEKTSFAFRLVFQSAEKTLTDDEANAAMNAVYEAVKEKAWEVR